MPHPHPRLRALVAVAVLCAFLAAVVGVGSAVQDAPEELPTEIAMASAPSTTRVPSTTVTSTSSITTTEPPTTTTTEPTTTTTEAPTTTTTEPPGPSEEELAEQRAAEAQREEEQAAAKAAEEEAARAEPPPPETTVAPPPAESSTGIPDSYWDRMAQCETGGNWAHYPGATWSGGLGMYTPEWMAISGGKYGPSAGHATREQQIEIANQWVEKYGGVHGGGLSGWGCLPQVGYP